MNIISVRMGHINTFELVTSLLPLKKRKGTKGMGQMGREQGKGEGNEPIEMEQKGVEGSKAQAVNGKGLKERNNLEKREWMKGKVGGRSAMGERFAK